MMQDYREGNFNKAYSLIAGINNDYLDMEDKMVLIWIISDCKQGYSWNNAEMAERLGMNERRVMKAVCRLRGDEKYKKKKDHPTFRFITTKQKSVVGGGKKNIFDLTELTYSLINDSGGMVKGEDVQETLKKYGLHKI